MEKDTVEDVSVVLATAAKTQRPTDQPQHGIMGKRTHGGGEKEGGERKKRKRQRFTPKTRKEQNKKKKKTGRRDDEKGETGGNSFCSNVQRCRFNESL